MGQLFKNVASQKVRVFAFADAGHASLDAGEPVTGDAANISARVAVDNAALGASNDVAPTEIDATNAPGYYEFDPTQAETNGDVIEWYPKSSTAGVQVVTVGGNVQTTQPPNFPTLGIESDGDVTKVNTVETTTTNSDMRGTDSAATATALATAQADLDTITGSDGATLATAQGNYAPAKAGDAMALTSGERTTLAGVIWDSLTSGMVTVGSIGKKLADWTIHSAADVWAVATRVLTANTNLNDPTAAAIADAVWTETLADHSGSSGSTAEALNAAGAAGDPWTTALPGAYGAGSAGNIVGNLNDVSPADVQTAAAAALTAYDPPTRAEATSDKDEILAAIAVMDAIVDAILVDTDTTIPALIAALNDLDSTAAQAAAAAALAAYDPPTKAELDSGLAALNDPTAAAVAAAILAAGDVDGFSVEETLKLVLAACAGKLSGAATTTATIRAADDSKDRITATVDADGNRSAVTLDAAG